MLSWLKQKLSSDITRQLEDQRRQHSALEEELTRALEAQKELELHKQHAGAGLWGCVIRRGDALHYGSLWTWPLQPDRRNT